MISWWPPSPPALVLLLARPLGQLVLSGGSSSLAGVPSSSTSRPVGRGGLESEHRARETSSRFSSCKEVRVPCVRWEAKHCSVHVAMFFLPSAPASSQPRRRLPSVVYLSLVPRVHLSLVPRRLDFIHRPWACRPRDWSPRHCLSFCPPTESWSVSGRRSSSSCPRPAPGDGLGYR